MSSNATLSFAFSCFKLLRELMPVVHYFTTPVDPMSPPSKTYQPLSEALLIDRLSSKLYQKPSSCRGMLLVEADGTAPSCCRLIVVSYNYRCIRIPCSTYCLGVSLKNTCRPTYANPTIFMAWTYTRFNMYLNFGL